MIKYNKPKEVKTSSKKFTLCTDFNPGYPNIGKILHDHKHIFDHDPVLKKVIPPENIIASFRGAKTINDLLIHSRLPPLALEEENDNTVAESCTTTNLGCVKCDKNCYLCRNYIKATNIAYSYHTNVTYEINGQINCCTPNIVYLLNDKLCKISNVGYTTITMKNRFSIHKSHIKKCVMSCEFSKHFIENETIHNVDRETKNYKVVDDCLKDQIEIILLEAVDLTDISAENKLQKCEEREKFWQDRLRTLRIYGGMNVRESKS